MRDFRTRSKSVLVGILTLLDTADVFFLVKLAVLATLVGLVLSRSSECVVSSETSGSSGLVGLVFG